MTDERKQELVSLYAYNKSKELNPEKYGSIEDPKEWVELLKNDSDMVNKLSDELSKISDEDLEKLYNNEQVNKEEDEVLSARRGAKLDKLKKLQNFSKSMKKQPEAKKCSCGCDIVEKKDAGGKIISRCGCGCKTSKKLEKAAALADKMRSLKTV